MAVSAPTLTHKRNLVASTRVTPAERALLKAAAVDEGVDLATLIRRVVVPYARQRLAAPGAAPDDR